MKYMKLYEYFNSSEIKTTEELVAKLKEYGIPHEVWGKGESKSAESLLDEIVNGECNIVEENGQLVRYIEFVGVNIFYNENGNKYLLVEDRQVFNDGRVRRRKMLASVSEKMKPGENPLYSAIRGVKEELGIDIGKSQLEIKKDINYDSKSQSYPGLSSKYKGYIFNCDIIGDQYKEEGYIEVQKDKSTFFVWEKV